MKSLWYVLLIFLVAGQAVNADDKDPNDPNELSKAGWDAVIKDPNDPNELLRAKWDAVIKVLDTNDIDQKAKEKLIDKIVSPTFDFPLMAKLVLGREHWPKLTAPQCEKFTLLFTKRLKDSYREKIMLYANGKALFEPAVQHKSSIHILMVLISNDKKIDILYKFRKVEKCWKIYDVEIQGVSILLTYRSQFNDILHKGSVEDLLVRLENPPTH